MIVALALSCAGCSGINTTQSVSPASFFLPGLLKAGPPQTNAPALQMENPVQLATLR